MLRLYRWNADVQDGEWIEGPAVMERIGELCAGKDILWLDMETPSEEEETFVFEKVYKIHSLSLEDVKHLKRKPEEPPHFPKVEEFPDYLFVIVNPLAQPLLEMIPRKGGNSDWLLDYNDPVTQLSAILTERLLITHHYEQILSVSNMRGFLERHEASARRGPDFLFHIILDEMVDEYATLLDHFDEALDVFEERLIRKPSPRILTRMIRLKRAIVVLRKTLVYEREVLARMSRGDFSLIDEREAAYYRNVYDHLIRFTELIETSREMVNDLMQLHLAATSNRMNEVMKVLTMISTTVLPMTLIAGIYGMNFERLVPATDMKFGFEIALVIMGLSGALSYLFFKWRKWI